MILAFVVAMAVQSQHPREPQDSSAAERAARHAQADFESARRNLSPDDGYPTPACEIVIGRFCYWTGEDDPDPPPEPPRVAKARDKMLTVLSRAADAIAGDAWVVGQQVRYLIEAGRTELAVDAARACRATPWWCAALTGSALHAASDFAAADSAFNDALAEMPAAQRCTWNDVSPLLDSDVRDRFARLTCMARDTFVERFWWLAQPLWSEPHNDLRSEHYARLTLATLLAHSASTYAMSWGPDVQELTVRFGWPTVWTRETARPLRAELTAPHMRGHDPKHGVDFTPSAHAVMAPSSARAEDWTLNAAQPRSRYAPAYAVAFAGLPHQLVRFRRGDSTLVVVACDPHVLVDTSSTAATDAAHERVQGALVLAHDPATPPRVTREVGTASDRAMVFAATVPRGDTLLLSAELLAPWEHRVARARYALQPPAFDSASQVALSDVLLFEPSDTVPADVDAAAAQALPRARVRARGHVGVYFEAYGFDTSSDSVGLAITVDGVRRGWFHRLEESLHLASRASSLAIRWHETLTGARSARALILDLATLRPGHYHLAVTLTPGDHVPRTTTRDLEIAER